MRAVAEIPIPVGGQVALRPGAPALVIPYIELDTRFREAGSGR